ncbi:hypothetical protein C4588_07015 [Candidatus Parcubacteria bacterium]|nr:MAG: hypothetical protein C4588_07015 [Candidatus Parcubacteria bacterium]
MTYSDVCQPCVTNMFEFVGSPLLFSSKVFHEHKELHTADDDQVQGMDGNDKEMELLNCAQPHSRI